MKDRVKFIKKNNVIEEVKVVDSNGKEWGYEPDFINFDEIEHENTIEALEHKKEQLTRVLAYNEKELKTTKKIRKIARFCYPLLYIFFFALVTIRTPMSISSLSAMEILDNACFAAVFGTAASGFFMFFIVGSDRACAKRSAYFKGNLAEIEKDLEAEKAKEIVKSKDEIEFQIRNKKLEELDRKYTRTFGSYYTNLESNYTYVINAEVEEKENNEKPKTIGSKKKEKQKHLV